MRLHQIFFLGLGEKGGGGEVLVVVVVVIVFSCGPVFGCLGTQSMNLLC